MTAPGGCAGCGPSAELVISCTRETIAASKKWRTVLLVTPSEHPLGPSIQELALALAAADEAGWDILRLRAHLPGVVPCAAAAAPVLADVLVAAHAVLVGVSPDLAGLAEVWPSAELETTALLAAHWLRLRFGAA